jgi:hypothetical protein
MTQRITELFDYADGKLLWKVSRGRVSAGTEAGVVAANGRMYVQVDGKKTLVHRIVWMMHHGDCPEFIDHKDGNPLNNSIDNLRPATKSQNAMNRKVKSDNLLGIKGVSKRNNKYAASIWVGGKSLFLGMFNTINDASDAYKAAASKHFGEFAYV